MSTDLGLHESLAAYRAATGPEARAGALEPSRIGGPVSRDTTRAATASSLTDARSMRSKSFSDETSRIWEPRRITRTTTPPPIRQRASVAHWRTVEVGAGGCTDIMSGFISKKDGILLNQLLQHLKTALLLFIVQLALSACATGANVYFDHSFDFDSRNDGKKRGVPDIEVLDYAYGDSRQFGLRPSKEAREMRADGRGYIAHGISGMLPRGEYLYVKWRVKETGEIYEDKVDLHQRMPADISNHKLHFAIFESQLYVFLFPPYWVKDSMGRDELVSGLRPVPPPGKTLLDAPYARQYQIYPDVKR